MIVLPPRQEGYRVGKAGGNPDACPYKEIPEEIEDRIAWLFGYLDGNGERMKEFDMKIRDILDNINNQIANGP